MILIWPSVSPPIFPPGNPDADQVYIYGQTEDGTFEFKGFPNDKGFLGKLVTTPFQAKSRAHAEEIAYRAIASPLSSMSLHLDIPLEVGHRETKELATGSIQISFVSPYLEAPMAISSAACSSLSSAAMLLYTEKPSTRIALSTNSFVCSR